MRICPEQFTCNAYLSFEGNLDAINAYRGHYMTAYSWQYDRRVYNILADEKNRVLIKESLKGVK